MGLNAFFVYTVCFTFGLSYANALVLVLVDGIVFVLLTVTGLRKMIFDAIPAAVKTAISAGIGLFIAFIGLQNAGIVVDDGATLVNLSSFNVFSGSATWANIFPMLLTIIAVFAIGAMSKKKVKGAVLWGMLGGAVLYYVIGLITVPDFYATAVAPNLSSDFFGAFKDFGTQAFGKVFTEGFDFSPYIAEHGMSNFIVMFLTTMLAFCMVDMFDTLGTLYGACAAGNMLTKDATFPTWTRLCWLTPLLPAAALSAAPPPSPRSSSPLPALPRAAAPVLPPWRLLLCSSSRCSLRLSHSSSRPTPALRL